MSRNDGRTISRADLEAAFRKVVGEGERSVESAAPAAVALAGAAALALLAVVYLAGRRRGRRKSSVVEIRRL